MVIKLIKRIIFFSIRLLISLGILLYLFHKIDINKILIEIISANIPYIIFAFILYQLVRFLEAYQLNLILSYQGIRFSTNRVFMVNLTSFFYSLFTPGGVGCLAAKWYKLSKPQGKKWKLLPLLFSLEL